MSATDRLQRQLCNALRDHLRTGQSGQVPEAGRLYWRMFGELSAGRTYGMNGPNPLTWADIDAWARLSGWPVKSHQIAVLRAMDAVWIEQVYRKPEKPTIPATPAALDAAFDAAGWG